MWLAAVLLGLYVILLCYRSVRFFRAWMRTQAAKQSMSPFDAAHRINAIVANCNRVISVDRVRMMSSPSLSAAATIGIFHPWIMLPEALAAIATDTELTATIGHELEPVWRRDYVLNSIDVTICIHPS